MEVLWRPALDGRVSFLLDANVVSEWTKPRPNAGVTKWLSEAEEDEVFLSVVTVAELRYGIERLPQDLKSVAKSVLNPRT